jgi:hypothetical protein
MVPTEPLNVSLRRGLLLLDFFPAWAGYDISRARAEPAFGEPRSRTRTTHWWQPPAFCAPLQEGQVGVQEPPHNTEGLPLFSRGAVRASW